MDDTTPPPLSRRARLARTAVVGTAGLALCAAAVALGSDHPEAARVAVEPTLPVTPLNIELRRCKSLEERALTDADCRRVWTEQRRRFLGGTPASDAPR